MAAGKSGRSARYACSRMRYCDGIKLLARSRDIGKTAIVPFKTPVALFGYCAAMGFGWSTHVSAPNSTADAEKYDVPAYRSARIDRKLTRKYCSLEFCIAMVGDFDFGRETERKARSGWHSSTRSRQVLNIISSSLLGSVVILHVPSTNVRNRDDTPQRSKAIVFLARRNA